MAQRLQKTDTEKIMNQLVIVGVPDYGQEEAMGNIRGMEKWENG